METYQKVILGILVVGGLALLAVFGFGKGGFLPLYFAGQTEYVPIGECEHNTIRPPVGETWIITYLIYDEKSGKKLYLYDEITGFQESIGPESSAHYVGVRSYLVLTNNLYLKGFGAGSNACYTGWKLT